MIGFISFLLITKLDDLTGTFLCALTARNALGLINGCYKVCHSHSPYGTVLFADLTSNTARITMLARDGTRLYGATFHTVFA